jgi:hypothetical protein
MIEKYLEATKFRRMFCLYETVVLENNALSFNILEEIC